MSPEQAKGKAVDRRSDIWALGVILWEMLTGRVLFGQETVSETLASVLRQEPPWEELAGLPVELRSLLRRCLERDPDRRFRDAADVALVLEDLRRGLGSGIVPGADLPGSSRTAGGGRVLRGTVVVLGLLSVVLVGLLLRPGSPEPTTPLRLTVNLPPSRYLTDDEPCIALSPDGRRLVYVAVEGESSHLWLRSLDDFEARLLPGTDDATSPEFSPDGRWVAFLRHGKLCKLPLEGGSPVEVAPSDWSGIAWTEKEELIFAPSYASGLSRVAAAGGPVEVLTVPDSERGELGHWWPQSLPGGDWVLFTVWSTPLDSVAVRVLSLETGEQEELLRGGTYARYAPTGHLLYTRNGQLMAQLFDADTRTLRGAPVPVLDDVPMDANDGNAHFTLAGNGTLAHLSASELLTPRNLVWVDMQGLQRPFEAPTQQYSSPRLSPDGGRLAVTIEEKGNTDIWILDRNRGTWSRFTFGPAGDFNPLWTPDGKTIYYNVEQPQFDIYRRPSDAGGPPEEVLDNDLDTLPTSISADGSWLLYTESHPETQGDLWVLPLEGTAEPQVYLKTPFTERKAAFSRDGRWVAYESDETGDYEVYVRGFPEPGRPWQISSGGGYEPFWSRDGRYLFYRAGEAFYRVTVTTGEGFQAGRPEKLFDVNHRGYWAGQGYEESMDGTELLVVQTPPESLPRSIRIVTHWLDELERRVPR
jgi:Tol biopolymer transport system component